MSGIILVISFILVVLMIISAVLMVNTPDLLVAIIASAVIDLVLAILFFVLHAPDVAITQASIMAGLTTIIFIVAIKKTERYER